MVYKYIKLSEVIKPVSTVLSPIMSTVSTEDCQVCVFRYSSSFVYFCHYALYSLIIILAPLFTVERYILFIEIL